MRKFFIVLLFIFYSASFTGYAQSIVVSFNPSDNQAKIDSIIAFNQATQKTVVVSNSNSIVLSPSTNADIATLNVAVFTVYPNPFLAKTRINYYSKAEEMVSLTVVNNMGQVITALNEEMRLGMNSFELSLKSAGFFWLTIKSGTIQNTFKIINLKTGNEKNRISYLGSGSSANREKSAIADPVQYQFDVYSGGNITRIVDKPVVSKTFTVDFHECKDAAGRKYRIVKIGTQWWMAENLAYLPAVSSPSTESNIDPVYYVYGYNGTNATDAKNTLNFKTYGALYNWKASLSACPAGWHLPTDAEYSVLAEFLGGSTVNGGKLKESGTLHWGAPNTGATNESGFSALPGGYRNSNNSFFGIGGTGYWWNATEFPYDLYFAKSVLLMYGSSTLHRENNRSKLGFNVRCIKN